MWLHWDLLPSSGLILQLDRSRLCPMALACLPHSTTPVGFWCLLSVILWCIYQLVMTTYNGTFSYWLCWAHLVLAMALHTMTIYWLHWVNVVPAQVHVVLAYLLHWANGIPALAFVVFTYLLHRANRIPALAPSYKLTYLHIGYTGLT